MIGQPQVERRELEMPLFDTHIVVDWSARSKPSPDKPSKDSIWWAAARDGVVCKPAYVQTRQAAVNQLTALLATELAENRRVLVGFDFPFGYPLGVAEHLTEEATAFALWKWLAECIEDDERKNNRFAVATKINDAYPGVGPCWGRPIAWDYPRVPVRMTDCTDQHTHPPAHRITEKCAKGAKTVWQLYGRGSVGSQALLGLPAIQRLRSCKALHGHIAVWPFECGLSVPDEPIVFAEVYPSLLSDAVKSLKRPCEIHDCTQVRVNAQAFASLDATDDLAPLFRDGPHLPPKQTKQIVAEEGWILGVGFESELADAARGRSFIGALRGTVVRYDGPFDPAVPNSDWSALK